MILEQLVRPEVVSAQTQSCVALMRDLYPICRTIAGPSVRATLDLIGTLASLQRTEIATGTPVFDWEIPREWIIRDAYIAGPDGRRVVDFRQHNLHVVNYSTAVRRTMSLEELQPFLHSDPDHPDWIPYRTSYYRDHWGFCLTHRMRESLRDGLYEVVIDADHIDGALTYGECVIPGSTDGSAIVYTHVCHPSLANDNLTGIAVSAMLARELASQRPRLTWRFVFGPGTIGSLAWLSRSEANLPHVRCGFTLGLLGDASPLTYKRSRLGTTMTDRTAELVLGQSGLEHKVIAFEPYGYDERQFCSPGFDLPVGRLSRATHAGYPEYHSSADNLELVSESRLGESLAAAASLIGALDANRRLVNVSPKGEPRLGKRGLYGMVGGRKPGELQHALLWVLSYSDGHHDLVEISRLSGLAFASIVEAGETLEQAGLVRELPEGPKQDRGVQT